MPIKGRIRALLEKVGRAGTRMGQALSWARSLPSPAWTLVTPYYKRTRPGRGTNTKVAGFPPLSRPSPATSLPPFALGLASTHLGWGTRRYSLVGLGTPRSRNADTYLSIEGSKYGFVIVNDYAHFTWVLFLDDKHETQGTLKWFLR
jgi:hypothetical protein